MPINTSKSLSILHLGFEDYRRPGSGGGSVRTHEINRRIAKFHKVTVLVANYQGAIDRTEDGVRYVHIGRPAGYFGSIISYFFALPFAIRRFKSDLLIEDFAAPFSSCLAPLWTKRPVIAMVQWLDAKGKSKQYHLPFWIFENIGLRLNLNYIAVSNDLAGQIREANPKAHVEVVPNGVSSFSLKEKLVSKRSDVLYLGRIERSQKGLDLLLNAFKLISDNTDYNLIIAGNGPDEGWLKNRIKELGLSDRVKPIGRIEGDAKRQLLASAKVVVMPSRYETFGMVAVEALAEGTKVIAFNIPCLREVVPTGLGVLVPAFDENKLADAMLTAITEPFSSSKSKTRRAFASRFDWDDIAVNQQKIYEKRATLAGANS